MEVSLQQNQLKFQQMMQPLIQQQMHLQVQQEIQITSDNIRFQPIDLLSSLCLVAQDFVDVKQSIMFASNFKKQLDATEKEDIKSLSSDLDSLEVPFDVTYLIICSIFGYTEKGLELIKAGADVNKSNRNGLTALMFASMFHNVPLVKILIQHGADVNLKDRRHINALMWTVLQGHTDIVQILLDNNADVHNRTPSGMNAVHIAVEKGITNIFKLLMDKNADISSKTNDGWTPLMRSVRHKDFTIAKLLLSSNVCVNEKNFEDNTALHISGMNENVNCIKKLLYHDTDINCTNAIRMTPLIYICSPLQYAIKNKSSDIVKHLLKFKDQSWHTGEEFITCLSEAVEREDINAVTCLLNFQSKTLILKEAKAVSCFYRESPLIIAASLRNLEIVELLLNAGADVNTLNVDLQSVLLISVVQGDMYMSRLVVEKFNANINLKDCNGNTPLIMSTVMKNKEIVYFLLENNASRYSTNFQGVSAMMKAASLGCYEIVKSIYENDYDLNLSDYKGWTPLMFSAFGGDPKTIKFLLGKGANINAISNAYETPMMIAAGEGHKDAVTLLLEHGASANARDVNHQSAIFHAVKNGHKDALEKLLKGGADVYAEDCMKKTALMDAVRKGDVHCLKLLIQYKANCDQKDVFGTTPLIISAYSNFTECLKTLLDQRVSVNDSSISGNTALHLCSSNGHNAAVTLLLQHYADPNKTNGNGHSPLMLAAGKGFDGIVQDLLNCAVVNKDLRNTVDGKTSLMIAAQLNKLSTVKLLVQAGSNVNSKSESGDTALHLSVINGFIDVVKFFTTVPNIDLNAENNDGHTPLFLCVHFKRNDILKVLVDAGADVKPPNPHGVNFMTFIIREKCIKAFHIIIQSYKLSKDEKAGYMQLGKTMFTPDIIDLFELLKQCNNDASESEIITQTPSLGSSNYGQALKSLPVATSMNSPNVNSALSGESVNSGTLLEDIAHAPPSNTTESTMKTFNTYINPQRNLDLHGSLNVNNVLSKKMDAFQQQLPNKPGVPVQIPQVFQQHFQQLQTEFNSFQRQQDQVKSQPKDLLQSLYLVHSNYEALEPTLSTSVLKNRLEELELEEINSVDPSINQLELGFDVTYLMICATFGYTEKGSKLIDEGAAMDIQNCQGLTALMLASMFQLEDFVEMLILKGADVNIRDRLDMDALMWAVLQGNEVIVKMLVDKQADVNRKTPSGLDALHIAVEKGFTKIVEILLDKNANTSTKSKDGWTALMRSVRHEDPSIFKMLLKKTSDFNEKNLEANTALHISGMYGNAKCIKKLVKHGADVNCKNSFGMTPLMYAVSIDDVNIVVELLERGAIETINHVNKYKRSALVFAVIGNTKNVVEKLITSGANSNILDIANCSPLVYACKNKNADIAKLLIKLKNDSWHKENEFLTCLEVAVGNNDTNTVKCLINLKNKAKILPEIKEALQKFTVSPIIKAAMNMNRDILQLLLDVGVDVNSVDPFLQSALILSITLNDTLTAKRLVTHYGADVNIQNTRGDTALILAAALQNKTMIDFLLKNNASRQITNNYGVSAFTMAANSGKVDIVKSLYNKEYNLEHCDNQGWTPLMCACHSGDIRTVKYLLDKGARTNVSSNVNATPLIIASSTGKEELVSLLLKHNASVNAKDINKHTPLIHAALKGHRQVIKILLEEGADVDAGDLFSKTALMYAVQGEDVESTLELLQKANICQRDVNGITPLMVGAFSGSVKCTSILLYSKAPVNESNINGNTALHFCSSRGHDSVASLLLQNKADAQLTNENGYSPLMIAAAQGQDSVVKTLLDHKAIKKKFCNHLDGKLPLMYAAQFNRLSTVKLLVQDGVDVNAKSKSGDTALHLSVIHGCMNVVKYLTGVPNILLDAENNAGDSPLTLCVRYKKFEILKHFIESGADVKQKNGAGVNAINLSVCQNCFMALKITLQYCQLSMQEQTNLLRLARQFNCSSEIVELIENIKVSSDNKNNGTANVSESSSQSSSSCKSESFLSSFGGLACNSPEGAVVSGDVAALTELNEIADQSFNINLDGTNDKALNFYFTGDRP
ncbi:serine/threonine-protein phosphatase 6 regulatory ankyrin repeat subunit A, partial [Biomphalaria pfeifferi]